LSYSSLFVGLSFLFLASRFFLDPFKTAIMSGIIQPPAYMNPLTGPRPLLLKDARTLLTNPYLPLEAGYALNSEGMYHVAGHTYMKDVTGSMIDWWFGYVTNTEQYKQWFV
jgi:hypothetical protein